MINGFVEVSLETQRSKVPSKVLLPTIDLPMTFQILKLPNLNIYQQASLLISIRTFKTRRFRVTNQFFLVCMTLKRDSNENIFARYKP